MVSTILTHLAGWSSSLVSESIPDDVTEVARRCLIDTIGVSLAGSVDRSAMLARTVALENARDGVSQLVNCRKRLTAPAAAAVNATAAHALDFDDNCYAGVVHGSAVVLPATLAMAEANHRTRRELMTAFVAGCEVEYALGDVMSSRLYARGWWTTPVLGSIGAAAAASRILELDESQTANAFGLALAQAGGTKAAFASDAKPLIAGRAAEVGVCAALLSAAGATGPVDAVEHPHGFAQLFNGGHFDRSAADDIGDRWRMTSPGIDIKRIPVCLSAHTATDAASEILTKHSVSLDQIRTITCDVPQIVVDNLKYTRPRTGQEAKFSMQFSVAASLAFGNLDLSHLSESHLYHPLVSALMDRIEVFVGPYGSDMARLNTAPEGAHVTMTLTDGSVLDAYKDWPRGSARQPLSNAELTQKFMGCAVPILGQRGSEICLENLQDLTSDRPASDFLSLTVSNDT